MEFETPTSLAELYEVLKEIFRYYRVIGNPIYEEVELGELTITKIEKTFLTLEQIREQAETLLLGEKQEKIQEKKEKLNAQIAELYVSIATLETAYANQITELEKHYEWIIDKYIEDNANGRQNFVSFETIDYYTYEDLQADKERLTATHQEKLAEINEKISYLEGELANVESDINEIYEKLIGAKEIELFNEQEKLRIDIEKHNNQQDEKEQRYANTIKQAQANLKLKYLEIKKTPLTKDELMDLGYYTDVVSAICGYYNRFDPKVAFNAIKDEPEIMVYLEDYYSNVLYLYQSKALTGTES